jgi:Fe-S-cluster containining protein
VSDRSLSQKILEEYPRLGEEDRFTFSCHPGVSCFNDCCGDINIVLTPYDVLRLKNALGLTSSQFLERHTITLCSEEQKLPVFVLRMLENEGKTCPFVGEKGCGVYADRPWACRMYPVGLAAPGSDDAKGDPFYFLLREDRCKGHATGREGTIAEWLDDQGIRPYNEMGDLFREVQHHEFFRSGQDLDPRQMEMLFLACFDLDSFRRFVFESSFLARFVVDEKTVEQIRTDETALMKFGLRWVRYSLFGESRLMTVRPDANPSDQQERAQ